ncbi:MAG TPA: DUF5946 family protein [Blastocatellia bacterium]|nr:DUF5946 family protein [Blastocatellia bacterium]
MSIQTRVCPGCGLEMPLSERTYDRKFHASAECWSVFEEVLAAEFQDPVLFGQVHQLTVDTYAVQHAGGQHPDKSVCVHLVGLHLVIEQKLAPVEVSPLLQRLVSGTSWPHLDPPAERASLTVCDVALADSSQTHAQRVREWAAEVWRTWRPHHGVARELARDVSGRQLGGRM